MQTNVVLIMCDELRADALGCYGNPHVHSPNIDRLASTGTRFAQCMITQPTCTPSRASILSGVYPSALRTRMVGCWTPDDDRLLPRVLSRHGYRTAAIGKIHLVPQRDEPGAIERTLTAEGRYDYYGFQEIDLVNGHGDGCFGPRYTPWVHGRVPDAGRAVAKAESGSGLTRPYALPADLHSTRYIADRTIEFLDSAGSDPYLLLVSFPDPHHPFCVPEPYASMYDPARLQPPIPPVVNTSSPTDRQILAYRSGNASRDPVIGTPPHDYAGIDDAEWRRVKAIYYGMVSLIDEHVGRILDAIAVSESAERTLVVFVSDHGEYLGDHGFYGKGFHYDSVLHTPLIVAGPGVRSGATVDHVTSTLDIAPTILDIIGVEEPEGVQGTSLRETLAVGSRPQREYALTENDDDFARMRARTLTTDAWKITYYANERQGELYDRRSDPDEMTNLWDDAAFGHIRSRLLEHLLLEVLCSIDVSNGRRQSPSAAPGKWLPRHEPDTT